MKDNLSRHVVTTVMLTAVAVVGLQRVRAQQLVQGFEPGDPAVSSAGDASYQGNFQADAPPQGTRQYLLTTISSTDPDANPSVSGTNAISNASLQTFFNGISLTGGFEGSGVLIPFSIAAGQTSLTLQFDFLSNEPFQTTPRNDFAFAVIFNSTNTLQGSVNRFATVSTSTFTLFGAQDPFIAHTGYQTLSLSLAGLSQGNYTLGLGVDDAATRDGASGLLIDNIRIVPEPSTYALITFAGFAFAFTACRRRALR